MSHFTLVKDQFRKKQFLGRYELPLTVTSISVSGVSVQVSDLFFRLLILETRHLKPGEL